MFSTLNSKRIPRSRQLRLISPGERERRDYDDSVSAMAKLTFGSFDPLCANEASGEVAGFDSRAHSDKPWLAAALTRQSMVGAF